MPLCNRLRIGFRDQGLDRGAMRMDQAGVP